jgi:hypothetical protein
LFEFASVLLVIPRIRSFKWLPPFPSEGSIYLKSQPSHVYYR